MCKSYFHLVHKTKLSVIPRDSVRHKIKFDDFWHIVEFQDEKITAFQKYYLISYEMKVKAMMY